MAADSHAYAAAFCIVWTCALYFALKPFYLRRPRIWLSPAILVPTLTIGLLLTTDIPYGDYVADTHWLVWMLGPATVAFAVPIYEHRAIVRRHWLSLSLGVVVGMLVAVVSARVLAGLFHFSPTVSSSLMARSISTPFAMAVVEQTGGSTELVSLFTVITGLVGMIAGDVVLGLMHLSPVANGASLGASAHGFGTVRARQRGSEEGVVASLTMVLAGVLMVLVGPQFTHAVLAVFPY